MAPLKSFPELPTGITPHGAHHILHDRIPQVALTSYDETVVFNMMGGLAIPDRINSPGRVEVTQLKGLVPPWRMIDQKGATQDGITFVDALYDPIEVELTTRVVGKDPADCRRVARHLFDSLDPKEQSRLSFFTHQLGYWWAPLRWFQTPVDPVSAISTKTQIVSLRLRADTGFWQSYPTVSEFVFGYTTAEDDFGVDDPDDLGTGWTTSVTGAGTGGVHVDDGQIVATLANDKTMVARKSGTTATDNQVVEAQIGCISTWFYPFDAYADIWCRMANSGTPGDDGVRLRLYRHKLRMSYFTGGVETVMRERILIIPPIAGERWRVVAGAEGTGNERVFSVMRGGATIWKFKESGTGSPLGSSNRGRGLGQAADGSTPAPQIKYWAAGDNSTVTQEAFLELFNVGDQPMWVNYTCQGPGLFRFWNGQNAGPQEYVEFGPLEAGQTMYLRTDPRKRGVKDMTATAPTPQQLTFFQEAIRAFLTFAAGNNATPLVEEIESWFGIRPLQGNPYSLLRGRWNVPIPPKSPGRQAQPYRIKVSIDDGDADSKIIATGTPYRRWPW